MSESKQNLPPKTNDHIVEVSLKHVVLAFGGLVLGSLTVGAGIVFVRDYAKYRRQKAIIDATKQLLTGGQSLLWNEKTTVSSSPMKTSKKSKKSSAMSD